MRQSVAWAVLVVGALLLGVLVARPARAGGGGKLTLVDVGGSAWLCDGRDAWRLEGDVWVLKTRYFVR